MNKINQFKFPDCVYPFASDLPLTDIPRFKKLEGHLSRIAGPSGVTYLKQSSVKSSVYLGSKYHAIDINGVPWEKKTELKKYNGRGAKVYKKKKAAVETAAGLNIFPYEELQISENLSTTVEPLLTETAELPTKRQYKVKKSLVRNRILAYTNTKNGSKCLYFFTVTFPAGMPEHMGYRALNTWFTALRKQNLLHEYLWVAERQPNTGTIHFHIAVPHFMRVWHVNGIMRTVLRNYAKAKEIPFSPDVFKKYNGVDIAGSRAGGGQKGPKIPTNFAHKKKSGSLANYLTKYVTKNNETFDHLAWHNSRGFSVLFYSIALSKESFEVTGLHKKLNWSKKFENENFVFVPWWGNAPPEFWQALAPVNNFFQSPKTYIINPVTVASSGARVRITVPKINLEEMKQTIKDAQRLIDLDERRQRQAFLDFCGANAFGKWFSDKVHDLIIERVGELGMQIEFADMLALLASERDEKDVHGQPAFYYTYHLYIYWVVDLLNNIEYYS